MTDTTTRIAGPTQQPNQLNPFATADTLPGTPLYPSAAEFVAAARANATATAVACGLAMRNAAQDEPVPIQFAGPLDLSTDEWDAITGDSGGLTVGAYYYVSSAAAGKLVKIAPTIEIRVGLALSSTTMLVQIGDLIDNT